MVTAMEAQSVAVMMVVQQVASMEAVRVYDHVGTMVEELWSLEVPVVL